MARGPTARLICALAICVCAALLGSAMPALPQPVNAPTGGRLAWSFRQNVVRIIATGLPDDDEENGFGFVFGEQNGELYVATADHVVRKANTPAAHIGLRFFGALGESRDATLLALRLPPAGGDLAVLRVPTPPGFKPFWPAMVPSYMLQPGDPAWRIGKGDRWNPPNGPGSFQGRAGALWLEFDNLDTPRGSSGGPILGDGGLIGIVVKDGGLSNAPAQVLPADTIAAMLQNWQLPWQLGAPGLPVPAITQESPPPPATATPPPASPLSQRVSRPPPPLLSRPLMEQATRQMLQRFFTASAEDPAAQIAVLDSMYASAVMHNGRLVRHAELLQSKRGYAEEWPQRRYLLRPNSVAVDCNVLVASCRVEALVDWSRRSAFVGQQDGQTRFTFSIDFSEPAPKIIAETEIVPDHR